MIAAAMRKIEWPADGSEAPLSAETGPAATHPPGHEKRTSGQTNANDTYWIAVLVWGNRWRAAVERLEQAGYFVAPLVYRVYSRVRGQMRRREYPLLGRYLLVKLVGLQITYWARIHSLDGDRETTIGRVLAPEGRPIVIDAEEVAALELACALGSYNRVLAWSGGRRAKRRLPRRSRRLRRRLDRALDASR